MWIIILVLVLGAFLGGSFYLVTRVKKFGFIQKLSFEKKKRLWLISIAAVLLTLLILTLALDLVNCIIIMIHLVLIWLLCDLAAFIVRKIRKKDTQRYYAGIAAMLIAFLYLSFGWYGANHVERTYYSIESDKVSEGFRIVMFSDSHIGATFHADEFAEYVKLMQAEKPDAVIIAGDFVDDSTTREDMIESCKALSDFAPSFGVYFCYGNHDKGYFDSSGRGWSKEDLKENLEKNGVIILEDEAVQINDDLRIIGRRDASEERLGSGRTDIAELVNGPSMDQYSVVIDHQPNDYDSEEAAEADLVLSGHTHGGQFFPINRLGELIGANDMTYGHEKRGNTDFIVSSGIADWALDFKTGCISEYVVIDVK